MNCSNCGIEIKHHGDYCQNCGTNNMQTNLLYKEKTPAIDSNNTFRKIKTILTKNLCSIIIGVCLVIILLSVGFGSYYISYSKFSSDDLKKSQETPEKINKGNLIEPSISKPKPPDYYIFPKMDNEELLYLSFKLELEGRLLF